MHLVCICTTLISVYTSHFPSENEIDGAAFLELTESDVKGMVRPLGTVKKIMRHKHVSVCVCVCTCVFTQCVPLHGQHIRI